MNADDSLPDQADTVIVGAGIVGCNLAYQLTELGRDDVVVVDQGPMPTTGGSSSHAPGIMFQTSESKILSKFAKHSRNVYSDLEDDNGVQAYKEVGGIEVARSDERMDFLQRRVEYAESWGLPNPEILSPEEVEEKLPLVDSDVIQGGYYSPTDGQVSGVVACAALAREAMDRGAKFVPHTRTEDIETENGSISSVITENGTIECNEVVIATNIWARQLGEKLDVHLPVTPVEHQYTMTEPLEELADNQIDVSDHPLYENYKDVSGEKTDRLLAGPDRPILRDQDNAMYFRTHGDSYGIGSYNHEPVVPDPRELGGNEEDAEQGSVHEFTEYHMNNATHPDRPDKAPRQASDELLPATEGKELEHKYNGMFAESPNGLPVMGPVQKYDGLWTAAAIWVTHAGGAGKALAEWMENGVPRLSDGPIDLRHCNVNRFDAHEGSWDFARDIGGEEYRIVYNIMHPKWVWTDHQRDIRRTPMYHSHKELDAELWAEAGWEEPQWFESNADLLAEYGEQIPDREGWEGKYWSPIEGAEALHVRNKVGLHDMTSFNKMEVVGSDAGDFVQRLCTNDMDIDIGDVRYTLMCNEDGGVRADITVTRVDDDRYLLLTTGREVGNNHVAWVREQSPEDVVVNDVTSSLAAMVCTGPNARKVLSEVTDVDLSDEAFPFFTSQQFFVKNVPVTALRVSYAGELGWELYTPAEYGERLWEHLMEAGEEYDIRPYGNGALNALRIEKGFRLWGEDLHTEHNPYETDLGWAVDLETDFIGKEAVVEAAEGNNIDHKVACLTLDDEAATILPHRPIFDGDEPIGYVHSAEYGYTVGACVVYTYLPPEYAEPGTELEIQYEGERYDATVREEPLLD
ncbi:glycine cleavage T protein (aminomethyl transferase) [Haloterrigena salina JCM 13891]|uniref:Glycine cleavage T protein (Aminomethyl transferase) n=1 Tax=Haloterrigena salina JCM 13891 TaxID=1227488 RepID=M0BX20_9EURY|nr:FAD-dependent oxidoreductase [Haloterrigena salina]ELZ15556.1 glycine cleavage T protein (aminomethyl transferase) [Haloterrigena salina JCM 13891]